MGSKVAACAECCQNCAVIHRKHDPSPIVFSFFKVMYGKQFSELLIVPPRFTRLASLVCQNSYLEDTNGRKWNVVLSNVNGSLAFQKGWDEFSLYHGIELGDFVVFHYIMGSHFVVKIYGRNGCERLRFSAENSNPNKRAKTAKDSNARNGPCDSMYEEPPLKECLIARPVSQPDTCVTQRKADVNPSQSNGIGRAKVAPTKDLPEDLFMIDRDTSSTREDDRAYLFDLSTFEMIGKKADVDKPSKFEVETEVAKNNDVKKYHIAEAKNAVSSSKYDKADVSRNSRSFPSIGIPRTPKMIPHTPDLPTASGGRARIVNQVANFSQGFSGYTVAETSLNVSGRDANVSNSKETKINIRELGEDYNHMMKDKGIKIAKPEPVDHYDSSSVHLNKITCLVKPDSESFLELPECLPIRAYKKGANHQEQKLVFLRDPVRRLWPVVYHERNGHKVLASGWKPFRKANRIQPGDKCTFVVENIYEGIFQVQIFRR